jgi:hypothetical protein
VLVLAVVARVVEERRGGGGGSGGRDEEEGEAAGGGVGEGDVERERKGGEEVEEGDAEELRLQQRRPPHAHPPHDPQHQASDRCGWIVLSFSVSDPVTREEEIGAQIHARTSRIER